MFGVVVVVEEGVVNVTEDEDVAAGGCDLGQLLAVAVVVVVGSVLDVQLGALLSSAEGRKRLFPDLALLATAAVRLLVMFRLLLLPLVLVTLLAFFSLGNVYVLKLRIRLLLLLLLLSLWLLHQVEPSCDVYT